MSDLSSILSQYLSPSLVFTIPFLILVGSFLKKSNRVADTLIPNVLAIIGVPIALIVSLAENPGDMTIAQLIVWVITGVGQGVFLGATSVGIHQFIKQHKEYQNLKRWSLENELKKSIQDNSTGEYSQTINPKMEDE